MERDGRTELVDKLDCDTYGVGNRQRAIEFEQESVQRFEVNGAVGLAGFLVSWLYLQPHNDHGPLLSL